MSAKKGLNLIKQGIVLLLVCSIVGLGNAGHAAGASKTNPIDEFYPDEGFGSLAPYIVYPDAIPIEEFSGTITANFSANGSYTFKTKDDTTTVTLKLNMAIHYSRNKKMERITANAAGTRKTVSYQRPIGKLIPACRQTEEETISGTTGYSFQGSALSPVYWSKELKLFCFPALLGDQPNGWASPFLSIPAQVEVKKVHVDGGEVVYNSNYSYNGGVGLIIPGFGTSGTRWSRAVQAKNLKSSNAALGAWVETASTHGNSSGSYSTRLYSADGLGWMVEGAFTENGKNPRQKPTGPSNIIWEGTYRLTWSLGSSVPQLKMAIAPTLVKEYENWIPSPIDDDRFGQPTSLQFTAEIKSKEEGKPPPPGRIHFWLNDVSREKGQCTNYPLNGKDEPDLRFTPGQPHLIIDPNNPQHAYTKDFATSATVEVEALDTGAYGRLQATCEEWGLIAEDERTGRQAIAIPLDDNENDVADAWERQRGILKYNFPASEDEDNQPAKQRRNGDGYTLYEEYRGFMTLEGFVRTNPLKKDLFIYDPDHVVKEWYEPYNPSELQLHYIDTKMMKFSGESKDPANRWVNYNSSEDKWYARQYALYVKSWTTMDGTIGETKWEEEESDDPYYMFDQPLKKIYIVKISAKGLEKKMAGIDNSSVKHDTYRKMLTSVVIHEIGHGIGIHHHVDLRTEMEDEASLTSGVFDCAMRYTTEAEYARPELLKDQNRYCREGETWKMATDGKFRNTPSHNCFGQIDIKSDP